MWLIDQLAEQHIKAAQEKGELSNLPGEGQPLQLEDDSNVPEALRSGYRLLKNAGFLPPELEMRREALALDELLRNLDPDDARFREQGKRLLVLELALRQAGMNTDFLQGAYGEAVRSRLFKER